MQSLVKKFLKKFNFLLFLKYLMIFNIINPSLFISCQCDIDTPFLLLQDDSCTNADECPPDYIESGKCEISNEIIKTQFFNNMISLKYSSANLTHFDIYTTLNGDLLFLGSTHEFGYEDKRVFYVLNRNGRGYFTNQITKEESAIYIYENLLSSKTYGNLFSFVVGNKEYIFNISPSGFIEVYDLDSLEIDYLMTNQKLEFYSYRQHISSCIEVDNNYLLGLMGTYEEIPYFFIYKFNFSTNNENSPEITYTKNPSSNSKIVSCYKTVLKYVVCFFLSSFNTYEAIVYNKNFDYVTYSDIFSGTINEENFFKCAHYYEEVGIFGYFSSENKFTFKFKLFEDGTFKNFYNQRETLVLNLELNKKIDMSDIIK